MTEDKIKLWHQFLKSLELVSKEVKKITGIVGLEYHSEVRRCIYYEYDDAAHEEICHRQNDLEGSLGGEGPKEFDSSECAECKFRKLKGKKGG